MYFICLATGFALWFGTVSGGRLLFLHKTNNGDTLMRKCDICYDKVDVNGTYVVFGERHNSVYVTDRGYVTFGSTFTILYPHTRFSRAFSSAATLVAPFWMDTKQFANMPNLKPFNIWYRETTDPNMLAKAKKAIQRNFDSCGDYFKPTYLFIVTWERVVNYCDYYYYASFCTDSPDYTRHHYYSSYSSDSYYSYYNSYKRDTDSVYEDGPNPTHNETDHLIDEASVKSSFDCDREEWTQNYYQLVLATDGYDTFALFNYRDIQYEYCHYLYALTAINAGDRVRYWKHPDTYKAGLGQALTEGTNAGHPGRWIYKLSESQILDPKCTIIS